LTDILAQ